jgi:hypothetical protein
MRKIYVPILIFAALLFGYTAHDWTTPTTAHASVLTATPWAISGPGLTSESDAYVSMTGMNIAPGGTVLTATFQYGAATIISGKTTAFTPGAQAPYILVTYNLGTSQWSSSSGLSGTMSAAEITAVQSIISTSMSATIKDEAEADARANGVLGSGTTNYPW